MLVLLSACEKAEDITSESSNLSLQRASNTVNFQQVSTIQVGGEAASEISAFDSRSNKLFIVNVESSEISVYDISNVTSPLQGISIPISIGSPNSVSVHNGKLAVAVEAHVKQDPGFVLLYDANTQELIQSYSVGSLPDMVTFSPNGQFILSANEGEPNSEYTVDPVGSISIIDISAGTVSTLTFDGFNADLAALSQGGYRVFGPNATLAMDTEPEYIAVSDDSRYAWVTLQENNGMAKINLTTKTIESIYPLGFKDYNQLGNEIDPSDRDNVKALNSWPVYGVYMPDAIKYTRINGIEYLITANEGDSRDYDGFSEEERIKDLDLDPLVFPNADFLKENENIGRLKITSTLGDIDNDGDYDELYSYGARSFSIWSANGELLYDSGNTIAMKTLEFTPDRFNDDDDRSDDKGAEPESVETLKVRGNFELLFVGLERNDQVLVFDITNPTSPIFLDILSHAGDEAPEGLLAIPANESPSRKELLIVSNEDSGTVTIYQNMN